MKHSHLSLLAVGVLAAALPLTSLSAQTEGGPKNHPPKIEDRLNKMKESLSLTDDQVAKLKVIFEEQKAKLDPIFKDDSLTREQKREKAKPIADETKTTIDGVLTPEQKTKFDQIRKEREEKRKQKQNQ